MSARLALGIEIGGTKLQVGVGHGGAELLGLARAPVDRARGAEGIREAIPRLVADVLRDAGVGAADVAAVGVGFGGPVDGAAGRVLLSCQIEGWAGFPLRDWLAAAWRVPVAVHNDAKTAALAEAIHGAGRGRRRIFYVTVGSGVGGGLVVDGVPDVGQGLGAAEIGHTFVPDPDSGEPVELESVASGWGIERRARAAASRGGTRLSPTATGHDVAAAALAGDAVARRILDESADLLATAFANVTALLHPERVVIGGGVSLMGDVLWRPLREAFAARCFAPFRDRVELTPAALGEPVVVVGAVMNALRTLPGCPTV